MEEETMFKIIIVTHGGLSESLLDTSRLLLGSQPNVQTYSVWPNEDLEHLRQTIREEIDGSVRHKEDVLVLTDIFFGTPFNIVTSLMSELSFSHITGVNLPMLAEVLCSRQTEPLSQIMKRIVTEGKKSIMDCNEFLRQCVQEGT